MAVAENTEPERKGPSLLVQVALLVGLTAVAIGAGWLAGSRLAPVDDAAPLAEEQHEKKEKAADGAEDKAALLPNVLPLEPMTVNLAAPSSVWARLEVSLVFDGPSDPLLGAIIHQDLLAYLRTVKLEQLQSASGFQHLKSDLQERAGIRSSGRVTQVLVSTLLFE